MTSQEYALVAKLLAANAEKMQGGGVSRNVAGMILFALSDVASEMSRATAEIEAKARPAKVVSPKE
jgi:hypothetical protein